MCAARHTFLFCASVRVEGRSRLDANSPSNTHSRPHCEASNRSITYQVLRASSAMAVSNCRLVLATSLRRTIGPPRSSLSMHLKKHSENEGPPHLRYADIYHAEFASSLGCSVSAVYPSSLMADYSSLSCSNPGTEVSGDGEPRPAPSRTRYSACRTIPAS
jgi:hypothetical protein